MLDEIELELMLKESEEQFKRGEITTMEEMKKRTTERLNNGYYLILDEIELNRRLKRSLEQDERGEVFPIAELKKQFMEKLANGYYCNC
ncbi:MAG: hypothetical protein LBQ87_10320 [Candidatus Fibromonas sp.]|jgi:hypothetical protein|nr:hypothetical protein [Candidatus Fibromonas sp.]